MNTCAYQVVKFLVAQSWQIALLAVIVGLISWAIRDRSAHIRYLLWLVVLARCLVPPLLTVPVAVLPEGSAGPYMVGLGVSGDYPLPSPPAIVQAQPSPHGSRAAALGPRGWIALVWAVGALSFSLWIGTRAIRYTAWLRARRRPLPARLWVSVEDLCAGFRFRKRPRIWLLDDITQPFVWGVLRGGVYLPSEFATANRAGQQRGILAHELSHVAHFDAGVNLLQVLAQAVYWSHPLVWWANRRIRQEREKRCDETAVAYLNTPPEHYTGAIVDALAAERRSAHPVPSLAIVGSVRDIEERIKTMLIPGRTFHSRPSLMAATSVLLIAAVTIPTTLVLTARGQTQGASSTTGDKPEQPRYAARIFNSKAELDVFVQETPQSARHRIGRAPSAAPMAVPACDIWWVEPLMPVKDWDLLAREINENKVPGLTMNAAVDSDMKHLAGLNGLQWLNLSGTQVGDVGVTEIRGLTSLQFLRLDNTQVTDSGLEHFKGLTELHTLGLMGTKITGAGLVHLKGLSRLRNLWLYDTQITDAGLAEIKGLAGLQDLLLSSNQITDKGLSHLASLTKLRELDLGDTRITDAGLDHLDFSRLTDLDVSGTRVTDAGLGRLRGMTGLHVLNISRTNVTDAGLEQLNGLTGLRNLRLEGLAGLTDAGMVQIRGLSGLEYLGLWDSKITDTGLAQLLKDKGLPRLRGLTLAGTQVTDAGLAHLEVLTNLQDLYLSDTQITDTGLAHLTALTRLRGLRLNGTKITDAGLEHLKVLTGWEWLTLGDTKVTDVGLVHLKDLTRLRTLDLSGTQITDVGLTHLRGLTGLQWLILTGTQVTDAGVQQLQQSLPELTITRNQPSQR